MKYAVAREGHVPRHSLCECSIFHFGTQAAQAHFMNADVTLACERCCVTNGYLQRFVCDANGFS